ncbi:hypothetical protein AB6V46_18220, partial [Stenotrophomonas maltophilia]|uniref:hypothetical protein n=1 Tax=Stenotrophomonas maltophilia TaxID=40324 RepID=UPI0034E217C6
GTADAAGRAIQRATHGAYSVVECAAYGAAHAADRALQGSADRTTDGAYGAVQSAAYGAYSGVWCAGYFSAVAADRA